MPSTRSLFINDHRLSDTSIRNNILFGEEYDEERYNDTVFACALENDIEGLSEGDETRCGEKGLSLSGYVSFPFIVCRLRCTKSIAIDSVEGSNSASR